ncbi:MAG: hypothetical protein JST00_21125 [Deltaproteobacteria bacterium]|nr:hypothetical protein [Deltaproteobacteria bacterium]
MSQVAAAPSPGPMPAGTSFLDERAKARAVLAVKAFEAKTSAELVVTVKKRVRPYEEAHRLWGIVFAFAGFVFLLFFPLDFDVALMPLDALVAFASGYGLSRFLPPMERLALGEKKRRETVEQAAKAAFYDLGVSKTTGRTGLLVFVSVFERVVAIVADAGVTPEARKALDEAKADLEAALVDVDIDAFSSRLEALGASFAPTMARAAEDVNELSDEVR